MYAKDWFAVFKVKVSKDSYDQNMTVSTVYAEVLIFCYQTWFEGTLKWDRCVQGQGNSKFQNVNECLSGQDPLYH